MSQSSITARARGCTGGRKAKLTDAQAAEVRRLYAAWGKTVAEIGELFGITRESVYQLCQAARVDPLRPIKPGPRSEGRALVSSSEHNWGVQPGPI